MPSMTWKLRLLGLLLGLIEVCRLLTFAAADVYIMTSAYILDPLPDIPADFGPDIPDAGIEGFLRSADPEDACSPFTFTDFDTPWIALIARQQQQHPNNCTFDIKVWNAQNAGAMAAIVYDDVYESLIIMSKPKGHADPYIPSVFVSQKAGIIMRKLMTIDTIRVRITPMSSVAWLSMLMSAFLGVLALGVVLATFYVMRSWSMWLTGMHVRGGGPGAGAAGGHEPAGHARPAAAPPLEAGLPAESLRLLPVLVFEPSVSRASRAVAGPASGLGGGGGGGTVLPSQQQQQPGALSRAAAVGTTVWSAAGEEEEEEEEGPGVEEMRPLLPGGRCGGGDVEEGGWGRQEGEEEEEEEMVSRRSSESSGVASAAAGARLPRAPGAHAGETKRVCAICLESYVEGEKVRVLPCAHRFHMGCVDQWLGSRRYCPVCKHDASQPLPHAPTSSLGGDTAAAGSGRGAAGGGGGGAAGRISGWTLLFQGLVDLLRAPRTLSRQRPEQHQQPQQQPLHAPRARSRRQQSPLLAGPRGGAAAPPELQEPLVQAVAPTQQPLATAAAPATTAAPAGDVEAPGPSEPPAAAAGGASSSVFSGGAAASTLPIAIPVNASAADAAPTIGAGTAAPQLAAAGQQQQQHQGQQQAQATTVTAGGPGARVRAVLAGLWGSAAGSAPSGGPQYPSTL